MPKGTFLTSKVSCDLCEELLGVQVDGGTDSDVLIITHGRWQGHKCPKWERHLTECLGPLCAICGEVRDYHENQEVNIAGELKEVPVCEDCSKRG